MKKNLRLTFFICGTCSGVDRLKLPLKVCQNLIFAVFLRWLTLFLGNFCWFCQATLWKLLGLWEYWNVLSSTHCPRVWITVSNSSSVFSRLCKHEKKVSYCLKVKVFLHLSDAGEISELIMEMAFPVKWVLEVHEPCNEKLWSASSNSSVSPQCGSSNVLVWRTLINSH